MKLKTSIISVALGVVMVALGVCTPVDAPSAAPTPSPLLLNAAGATFPYPIYSKWFTEYNRLHPDIQINYNSIGSGGGIRQLQAGTVDFGASDAPMTDKQLSDNKVPVLHFPTVLGAVVPTYNIDGVTGELNFTGEILADIFTYQEKRGPIAGKNVVFIGDGACNVPVSWMFAAAKLNFQLRIAAPEKFQPSKELLRRAGGNIVCTADVRAAARGADLLYTDVWVSMGKESESIERLRDLAGYQINDSLVKLAKPGALVMHCLPAYRGKEIDEATFEANAETIFDQAENRLHCQKAIMAWMAG